MTENKFSKYLLYAIGEILLVVIGILFALQINNWNTLNNERLAIENYLEKINDEIELSKKDMQEFSNFVDTLIDHNNRSLDILNLKNRDSLHELKETLGALGTAFTVNLTFPMIDEFLREGYLARINNEDLKVWFQFFRITLNNINSLDDYISKQYSTSIEPYFYSRINYSEVAFISVRNQLKSGGPPNDYHQFYNDMELWNLLTFKNESLLHQKDRIQT